MDIDNLSIEQSQEMPDVRNFNGKGTRAIGNNTPDTAIYLPSSYFGLMLSNLATNNEDWYCFDTTGNGKATIAFSQQPSGQYMISLYKLDSTGTILNRVEFSAYNGTFQQIDYLATAGTYYLQMIPITPPTTSYSYQFEVYVSYDNDNYEINESYDTAYPFTNSMNVSANIDNSFDEDWYKLTLTSQKDLDITARFAQGSAYAVFLYDSSFNSKGSFYIDGVVRSVVLTAGTYYVRVASMSGYSSDTANYTLKIAEYVPPVPKPLGSISIPYQTLEFSNVYQLATELDFEAGGKLVFDMDCSSNRLGVVIDVRFEGFSNWERLGDFFAKQGSNQYTYDFPYRMDHIVGRPLWPRGKARITLVPDGGTINVSGTIKSMPR